jgi:hypothetical protein
MNDFGLLVAEYNTSLPTLVAGEKNELQVDSSGRLIIAGRFLEDSAHTSGDPGIFVLGVRNDAGTSLVSNDGDYAPFQFDANGKLYVNADISVVTGHEKEEDAASASGDIGSFVLAVRNDTPGTLVGTDGDYAAFQLDSEGWLRVVTKDSSIIGSSTEAYAVTDALVAAADGLEVITAAATPWVTVAEQAVGVGETLYLFGYEFACDQNAEMRIISDDTTDIIVYKVGLNSSAQPQVSEHFTSEGRIEIAGAASLSVKMQLKKRQTPGGNANGTGSLHARLG